MGQKVDPRGLRLGVNKDWQSKWYAEGEEYIISDIEYTVACDFKGVTVKHVVIGSVYFFVCLKLWDKFKATEINHEVGLVKLEIKIMHSAYSSFKSVAVGNICLPDEVSLICEITQLYRIGFKWFA